MKRILDIFFSLLFIVLSSPIMLFACMGIILSGGGSIIYKAQRVGKDERIFDMYKFRSLRKQPITPSFILNEEKPYFFGKFLRKTKIDELPQLFNILKGDMTFVGPRPNSINFVNNYLKEDKTILSIKPGLTSYASLFDYKHGDLFVFNEEEYKANVLPIKMALEKYYVSNKSFFVDVSIIAQTIFVIVAIVCGKKQFKYTRIEKRIIEKLAKK